MAQMQRMRVLVVNEDDLLDERNGTKSIAVASLDLYEADLIIQKETGKVYKSRYTAVPNG